MPFYGFQMLETYFGPCSGLVWSSLMTISGRAARSAALYGDGFGADFRPSDVDYESLPSLIKRFEGATRSGSMRSIQWCIVIHLIHSGSWSNSRVSEFLRFHLIPVSRGASRFHARSPPGGKCAKDERVAMPWSQMRPRIKRYTVVVYFSSFLCTLISSRCQKRSWGV